MTDLEAVQEDSEVITGDNELSVGRVYFVVGLGNPGLRYENTPHNMGFLVVDKLGERHGIRIRNNEGVTLTGTGKIGGREVVLAKPQTFMNRSGLSVKAVMQNRKLTNRDLILVYDDIDLPWTGLRIRKKGSAGGHNGVKSVIAEISTDWFARVRVGIHPGHEVEDTATYDLAPLERALKEDLDETLTYAAEAIESIIAGGAIQAMSKFNRRARGSKDEEE
ncbi:MAG TPA: aminoacyl-tRNA hydrolase [Bryobacteraceae bacterium]|nr:aminoacyl-tRNA hydrolase [Bryobacteraceae bacterium]